MAIKGQIIEYEWVWEGTSYKLFSKADRLEGLIDGLQPKDVVNAAPRDVQIDGYSRQAYPDAPKVGVTGHTRRRLFGGKEVQRTLPGQQVYFETLVSDGLGEETEVVTATITGPFTAFYQFVQANSQAVFTLRTPDGTPYTILDSAGS